MTKIISIITPIYNGRNTLARMLDSIVAQKLPKERYELILVDDNSDDKYDDILRNYKNDIDITCIKNTTVYRGPSAARQCGLDIAVGEWVTFIDADDAFMPDIFSEIILATIKYNNISCIDTLFKTEWYTGEERVMYSTSWLHGKFFDLNFIREHNIRFNPNIYVMEDLWFNNVFRYTSRLHDKLELNLEDFLTYRYIIEDKESLTNGDYYIDGVKYFYEIFYLKEFIFSNVYSKLKFFKLYEDNQTLMDELTCDIVCRFLDFYFTFQIMFNVRKLDKDYKIRNFHLLKRCKDLIEEKIGESILDYLDRNKHIYPRVYFDNMEFSGRQFYPIESLPDWIKRIDTSTNYVKEN